MATKKKTSAASKAKKSKKKPKYKIIPITLPGDMMKFFRKVSKVTNLSMSEVLSVVIAIESIKTLEAARISDGLDSDKGEDYSTGVSY